jgi:hypothetical protein
MTAISCVSSSRRSQVTREAKERDWELSQTWQKPPRSATGPSIVPYPDQSDLPSGSLRFIYSCGSLPRGGQLIIPDGMSDYATTLATVSLDEVLAAIQ